tara:strand:+ start:839 stop:1942 length:1104 start_codon:yes stop_codon:yes gene_type:complete
MAYTLVAVGGTVNASDYNNLQNEVSKILGGGSTNRGYGQQAQMDSGNVAQGTTINAAHMNNLKHDLDMIAYHQTGAVAKTAINLDDGGTVQDLGVVNQGNTIAAGVKTGQTQFNPTSQNTTGGAAGPDSITRAFNDYQQALENLRVPATNPFRLATSERAISTLGSGGNTLTVGPYTSTWNGTISHTVEVNFGSDNAARYFFNAGGSFRFTVKFVSTATGGNVDKAANWQGMLGTEFTSSNTSIQGPGIVEFDALTTTATGSGTPQNIGYWNSSAESASFGLTTSYQTIFTKTGSGTYVANDYVIQAKRDTGKVFFQIRFQDDVGGNPDELVYGQLTSKMEIVRAVGSLSGDRVQIALPAVNMGSIG